MLSASVWEKAYYASIGALCVALLAAFLALTLTQDPLFGGYFIFVAVFWLLLAAVIGFLIVVAHSKRPRVIERR